MNTDWLSEIQEIFTTYPDTVILIACAVVLIFVLWLILRSVKLWYWKVNDRAETLEYISTTLGEIRDEVCGNEDGKGAKADAHGGASNSRCEAANPTVLVQSDNATVVVQQPSEAGGQSAAQLKPKESAQPKAARGKTPEKQPADAESEELMRQEEIKEIEAMEPDTFGKGEGIAILEMPTMPHLESDAARASKYETRDCNIDKTGRVYTRAEIEESIRS